MEGPRITYVIHYRVLENNKAPLMCSYGIYNLIQVALTLEALFTLMFFYSLNPSLWSSHVGSLGKCLVSLTRVEVGGRKRMKLGTQHRGRPVASWQRNLAKFPFHHLQNRTGQYLISNQLSRRMVRIPGMMRGSSSSIARILSEILWVKHRVQHGPGTQWALVLSALSPSIIWNRWGRRAAGGRRAGKGRTQGLLVWDWLTSAHYLLSSLSAKGKQEWNDNRHIHWGKSGHRKNNTPKDN